VLVGDETYYSRVGFKAVPKGRASMPGPVDYGRLLVAELAMRASPTFPSDSAGLEHGAIETRRPLPVRLSRRRRGDRI